MNKKVVRIIAITIAALLILGLLGPLAYTFVFAVPTESNSISEQKKITLEDMSRIEQELNTAEEKVRELNEKVFQSAEALEEIDEKMYAAQELEKKYNEESGKRFRVMCEKGMMSYLDIIFSAEGLTDFIDRIVIAKELAEYDRDIMNAIKSVNDEIAGQKIDTEKLLSEQQNAMAEIESAKAELENKKAELKTALAQLEADEKAYIQYVEDKNRAESELRNQYSSSGAVSVNDVADGMFVWPVSSHNITSEFSPNRVNPVSGKVLPHTGTDIGANNGDPIVAAAGGTVSFAGVNSGYGNCVIINHGDGISTLYAHMSSISVREGDSVVQGDMIGRVGSTGNSTGPHLHFETMLGGTAVDPMQFFN